MKVLFCHSDKPREVDLAAAFLRGARRRGCEGEARPLVANPDVAGFDIVCMVGVKSKRLWAAVQAAGAVPIMLDKGYIRTRREDARVWEYWRVAIGAHHPSAYMMARERDPARFEALDVEVQPWRRTGFQILIAGSSAKYHDFYGLDDPTAYATAIVEQIRAATDRPIVYRAKPSWKEAVPIPGTYWSPGADNITAALANTWALITHGSNACFEAALHGIPSIVLGNGVAAPISSRSLDELAHPQMERRKRMRWLHNLAFCQFTEAEFASGFAWSIIAEQINDFRAVSSVP